MKTKIVDTLKDIETKNGVKILHAIESGSRSWGFPSPDSDYDIRFIYKHPKEYYLGLWDKKDSIDFMTSDNLDGSGWDLKKVFLLLRKSNVPLLEHLNSPIIYKEEERFIKQILPFSNECYSPISSVHHYLSMSKKYLESCETENCKLKSVFYCIRTTLASKWIIEMGNFPPVEMSKMLGLLPNEILGIAKELHYLKSLNNESFRCKINVGLIDFLSAEILKAELSAKSLKSGEFSANKADDLFLELLNEFE